MSGLWLFLIVPSGAIWRLDKNPSVHQLEFVNLGLPSMKQQWKHQATQDRSLKLILQPIFSERCLILHADLPGPLRCGYFESCRSCCQWTSSRYCHHFCHLDAKKTIFHPPCCLDPVNHWLLRSSQSWFLWFDLLQLGTRTVLITQNQHMNYSMNPLHDRTRIGWVGLVHLKISVIHPNSRNVYIAFYTYLAFSYTSSFSRLQNSQWISRLFDAQDIYKSLLPKGVSPLPVLFAVSLMSQRLQRHNHWERLSSWSQLATSLKTSTWNMKVTWTKPMDHYGPQTYRSNLRKERGFNSKPC